MAVCGDTDHSARSVDTDLYNSLFPAGVLGESDSAGPRALERGAETVAAWIDNLHRSHFLPVTKLMLT